MRLSELLKDFVCSPQMDNPNHRLIPFLRGLADNIEQGRLEPKELRRVGEFYMSYQFHKQAILDGEEDEDDTSSTADLVRFIAIGWYIYTHLLRDNRSSEPSESDE